MGKVSILAGSALFLLSFTLGAWLLSRKVSIDVARNKGIKKAAAFLNNPILAIDYAQINKIKFAAVENLINTSKLKGYSWGGFLFVESSS